MNLTRYHQVISAIVLAISLHSPTQAQTNLDTSLSNLKEQLASEWSDAVLTKSLKSATKINAIAFSPDGQLLASVGASQISIWDLNTGEIQRILPGHYAGEIKMNIAPTAIAFSPDSRFLATSTWSQGLLNPDQAIIVRDVTTGETVLDLAESDGCRQIIFDVTGEMIYGACGFGVTAWSFPSGEKLFNFDTEYPVEAIAQNYDRENKILATVDANVSGGQQGEKANQIQLWQLDGEQATLFKTLTGHDNEIAKLKFTADGKRLVSSSYDGKINVWDWQQGTINRRTNNLHSRNGVFSLSGNSQLIAGNFSTSTMASLITGLPLTNIVADPRTTEASLIAFSPSDRLFARVENDSNNSNAVINLWQVGSSNDQKPDSQTATYRSIPVTQYWSYQEPRASQAQIDKPSAIGIDPQAIALSALGLKELPQATQQQSNLEYLSDNLAAVTITQTKSTDDSVEGYRYLVKFAPYGDRRDNKWQVVWAGEQFRCWAGRGHQDWSTDLCQ